MLARALISVKRNIPLAESVDLTTLGKRLAFARSQISPKMTQAALAKRLGLANTAQISQWENDERTPETDRLIQLAIELSVSLEWLAKGSDSYSASVKVSPGVGRLVVEGHAPRGVISPARLSPEAVLKTRRVAQWLLDLRAELERLGATERQAEHAADLTAQVLRSSSVGGAQSEWTVDDAIEAMQDEAETWRATFRRLDGQ
jgi:transcriptional regulator with XRE-family HTH domain